MHLHTVRRRWNLVPNMIVLVLHVHLLTLVLIEEFRPHRQVWEGLGGAMESIH